jgi:hypothetical protein
VHRRRSLRSAYTHSNRVVSHNTFNKKEVMKNRRKKEILKCYILFLSLLFDSPFKMRLHCSRSSQTFTEAYRLLYISAGLLSCNAVWTCGETPVFQRNKLPPLSRLKMDQYVLPKDQH